MFLYRCLLATLRSKGHIVIAVATSGVTASILPGGRTAYSRFKIPLDSSSGRSCGLSKQSSTAKLIAEAKLIIWDEPFGGKVVVFGGDFRQTLPVIEKVSRDTLVKSSIVNSVLWPTMCKLTLKENMRARLDPIFSSFLLRIGEGLETTDEDGQITLPSQIVLPYEPKAVPFDE